MHEEQASIQLCYLGMPAASSNRECPQKPDVKIGSRWHVASAWPRRGFISREARISMIDSWCDCGFRERQGHSYLGNRELLLPCSHRQLSAPIASSSYAYVSSQLCWAFSASFITTFLKTPAWQPPKIVPKSPSTAMLIQIRMARQTLTMQGIFCAPTPAPQVPPHPDDSNRRHHRTRSIRRFRQCTSSRWTRWNPHQLLPRRNNRLLRDAVAWRSGHLDPRHRVIHRICFAIC